MSEREEKRIDVDQFLKDVEARIEGTIAGPKEAMEQAVEIQDWKSLQKEATQLYSDVGAPRAIKALVFAIAEKWPVLEEKIYDPLELDKEWWRKYCSKDTTSRFWQGIINNTIPTRELCQEIGLHTGVLPEESNVYFASVELLFYRTFGFLPRPELKNKLSKG